jgi:ESCRT-I complex subunit VPS28
MLRSEFKKDKKGIELQANIYSIVQTVEILERFFVRGMLSKKEYDRIFNEELLVQYKVAEQQSIDKLHLFENAPLAKRKFDQITVQANTSVMSSVLESGQHFVTLIDALKMGLSHADELLPVLRDLMHSLQSIKQKLPASSVLLPVIEWNQKLSTMKASDSISMDEARQFALDLDTAFANFHAAVKTFSHS